VDDAVGRELSAHTESSVLENENLFGDRDSELFGQLFRQSGNAAKGWHTQHNLSSSGRLHNHLDGFSCGDNDSNGSLASNIVVGRCFSRVQRCVLEEQLHLACRNLGLSRDLCLDGSDRICCSCPHSDRLLVWQDDEQSNVAGTWNDQTKHRFVMDAVLGESSQVSDQRSLMVEETLFSQWDLLRLGDQLFDVSDLIAWIDLQLQIITVWCDDKDSDWFWLLDEQHDLGVVWHSVLFDCSSGDQSSAAESQLLSLDQYVEFCLDLSFQAFEWLVRLNLEVFLFLLGRVDNQDLDGGGCGWRKSNHNSGSGLHFLSRQTLVGQQLFALEQNSLHHDRNVASSLNNVLQNENWSERIHSQKQFLSIW